MIKIINQNIEENLGRYVNEKQKQILLSSRDICHKIENGYIVSFRYIDIKNIDDEEDVYIVLNGESIVFLSESKSALSYIDEAIQDVRDVLHEYFMELISEDIKEIDNIEDSINLVEDKLLNGEKPTKQVLINIMELKHSILKIKRYYEQIENICDILSDNISDIFTKTQENKFSLISDRVNRLSQNIIHLYEVIIQVREVYQTQVDMEQNKIMKMFTVITTIFAPLTLIVGWYGMNLKMPEFNWQYGYYYVIGLSVIILSYSIFLFKKNNWF